MNGLGSSVEISDEERRRRLGRVYALLIKAAERRRSQLAQQEAVATESGDGESSHG